MIYVYDTPIEINMVSLERFGVNYKLEKNFKMGKRKMASFIAPGAEKILVVPQFIQQYQQLEKKLEKMLHKPKEDFIRYVTMYVDPEHADDELPSEESSSGTIYTMVCRWKDIRVTLEYLNGHARLAREFEIVENNLFGNGIVVDLDANRE